MCLDYLKHCPDTVKQIFLRGDSGCKNRLNGTCKFGQEYSIDGDTYWRCGCCNAPFYFKPIKEDIPHYIKLVELGLKKQKEEITVPLLKKSNIANIYRYAMFMEAGSV